MSKQHTAWSIVFALVILLVLAVMPAQAQDAPPVAGAASSALYLPQIERNFALWFTDDELDAAMERDGYNVEVASMHTSCTLDVTAVPPYLIRYIECQQFWVDGQATEGTDHYILWRKLGDGIVYGIEVGG